MIAPSEREQLILAVNAFVTYLPPDHRRLFAIEAQAQGKTPAGLLCGVLGDYVAALQRKYMAEATIAARQGRCAAGLKDQQR